MEFEHTAVGSDELNLAQRPHTQHTTGGSNAVNLEP